MTRAVLLATLLALVALPARAQDATKRDGPATVTLDVERAPLAQVLRKLCLERGFNFVADPRVLERAGDVTLLLKDVSFEEAIEAIGEIHDLEVRLRGRIVTVRQKAPPPAPPRLMDPRSPAAKTEPPRELASAPDRPLGALPKADAPPPHEPGAAPSTASGSKLEGSKLEGSSPAPAPTPSLAPRQEPAPARPEGLGPPPGSVLGTVVEVGVSSVKIKERAGEARDYFVPEASKDDLSLRGARIGAALKVLKKGDQCALTYEVDVKGRYVITNIIGGPKRMTVPEQPAPRGG